MIWKTATFTHVIEGVVISKTIVSQDAPRICDCLVAQPAPPVAMAGWEVGGYRRAAASSIGFVAVALESSHGDLWFEQGIGKASRVTIDPVAGTFAIQYFDGVPEIGMRWVNIFEIEGNRLFENARPDCRV
jgi:hypothetical protein